MKRLVGLSILVLVAFALQSPVQALVVWGTAGSGPLQGVLDGITTDPAGASNIDVTTDEVDPDAYWKIGGSGGAVSTVVIELAGFAGTNKMGVFDMNDSLETVELFAGSAVAGDQIIMSILGDGSVIVNFADTSTDFAGNAFGLYLDSSAEADGGFWFSDTSLNSADGLDHMAAYQGVGDGIEISPFAPGPWGPNEYIFAFEDLDGGFKDYDGDFTDFVVLIESVSPTSPIPEPGTLLLLGSGLVGLSAFVRRKRRKRT